MTAALQQLRALPHLSVSQLKCFVQCPRRFKYRYIDRLEPAFRAVALAFGSAWHHTIGYALLGHSEDKESNNGELHDHLRDGLHAELRAPGPPVLFDNDEDEGSLVDKAIQMLDVFVAEVPLPDKVFGVEVAFSIDLSDPVTGEPPTPLIGGIDAIVQENGKPAIWELKTAKRKWSQDQLDFDLQPSAYRLGAHSLGYDDVGLELLITTKSKTPAVQRVGLVRGDADECDLVATAVGVSRAVDAGVDFPLRGWSCRGCPYGGACT